MREAIPPSQEVRGADMATVAAAIGDRARAAILNRLMDGRGLPAGALARLAGVSPPTASSHLSRLLAAGLVRARLQGRHRYYELASPRVAEVLEALSLISPPLPVRSLRQGMAAQSMRQARSCYDHLAGRLGVALRDGLLESGSLVIIDERDHALTDLGRARLHAIGIDTGQLTAQRRAFARSCLDWSERRPHLAGALPAALLRAMLQAGWLVRRRDDRGLGVSPACAPGLRAWLGMPPPWPDVSSASGRGDAPARRLPARV